MFIASSIGILLAFLVLTVLLPFRFGRHAAKLVERTQNLVITKAASASFDDDGALLTLVRRARYLGSIAALLFVILCVKDGALFRNESSALLSVLLRAGVSLAAGGLLITTVIALASFIPKAQGYALLSRYGFRGLWVVEMKQPSRESRDGLARRIQGSSRVGIVDITGFELLGKGPGPSGRAR